MRFGSDEVKQSSSDSAVRVIALAIPCIIELLAQPGRAHQGTVKCLCPKDHETQSIMKNPLSHSERRGGEHSLLYSFSCAPATITVCRPGSFSVKRAQPLLGVFKSCVSWLQKQEPLLLSGHHQTFKQNPFYLKSQGKCDYLQLPGGTLIKTNTIIFSFTIFEQTGKWFRFMSSRKREKSHPVTSADNELFKWQPIGGSSTALVWTHRKETKPFFVSCIQNTDCENEQCISPEFIRWSDLRLKQDMQQQD